MKALGVDEIARFLNENPEQSEPDNIDPERMVEYCKISHHKKNHPKVLTMSEQGGGGSDRTGPVSKPCYMKFSLTQKFL